MNENENEKSARAIAVFAHNEAENIIGCLEAIRRELDPGDRCFVLNNGSSDDTGKVVSAYASDHPFCTLVNIELGDKANAWNVFLHELNADADSFIFIDGDCRVEAGSFSALERVLISNPLANAVSGVPDKRVSAKFHAAHLSGGGLTGALYALSAGFVRRVRASGVRLPVGLIGDDSLVGALAYWDLEPRKEWNQALVVACEGAVFSYQRWSAFSPADLKLYYRRKIRYSLRRFQNQLMRPGLKESGLDGIPVHVEELYRASGRFLKLEWRGLDTWFDYLALRRMRAAVA